MLLENQVAIVTGAARGIGRGIALELARHGAKIVAVDILGPDSEQTASECDHDMGKAAVFLASNLSDYITGCILPVAGGQPYVGVQQAGEEFATD